MLIDPGYFTNFWTKPDGLGFTLPASLAAARVRRDTRIAAPVLAAEANRLKLPAPGPEAGAPRGGNYADRPASACPRHSG